MYRKLYLYILLPTLLILLGLLLLSQNLLEKGIKTLQQKSLQNFAFSIIQKEGQYLFSDDKNKGLFQNLIYLDSLTGNRITLIDTSGVVIFDSRENPARMDNHRWRPEVSEALRGKIGFSQRESQTLKKRMLYCAVPVRKGDTIIGVVRVSEYESGLADTYKKLKTTYILFIFTFTIIAFIILTVLDSAYRKDIFRFLQAFKKLSENDFSVRILWEREGPLKELAEQFNEMVEKLSQIQKVLEDTEQKLKTILETIPFPLGIIDSKLNILYSNLPFKTLFADEKEKVDLLSFEILRQARRVLKESETQELKYESQWKGKYYQVYLKRVGNLPQVILIAIDVTDALEKERVKKELISHVSHDLKTPLTIIKGYGETILEECKDENINYYVENILKAVDELSRLITKLNTLSKLENLPEVEVKELKLKEFVESIITPFKHVASKKGLEFHYSIKTDTETVKTDPEKLKMIIVNLLDNAVKFTETGRVELEVVKEGDELKITVSDTGPGIPENLIPRIFERFFTLDKSRGAGFGLGLAIVKHAVQTLKGSIDVRSQVGLGTTFTVTIPKVNPL